MMTILFRRKKNLDRLPERPQLITVEHLVRVLALLLRMLVLRQYFGKYPGTKHHAVVTFAVVIFGDPEHYQGTKSVAQI